jgi:hypothetical protein
VIDSLKIEDSHAKAIIQLAIDNDAYDGKMPSTKKDRIEAAHDIVTFAIDAWVQDEVRSDSDDPDLKKAGKTVEKILSIAGVKVDESGVVGYEKPKKVKDADTSEEEEGEEEEEEEDDDEGVDLSTLSRAELKKLIKDNEIDVKVLKNDSDDDIRAKIEAAVGEDEEEEEGDEEESEDEAPFDVNDIIDGWSDMKTTAALKAIEENADELDQEQVKALLDDEQSGSKPRSKIIDALEAVLNAQMGGDEDEENGEPWEGYDGASVKAVKETLEAAKEDEDEPLDAEQAQFVLAYEKENQSRAGIIKWLEEFIAEADSSDDADDEEEEDGDETADEAGDGEEEGEEDDDEGVDLEELDRAELKALIKEQEWDIKVQKKWSDAELRQKIAEYAESQEEEEEEEEPEPEPKKRGAKKGKTEDPDDSNDVDEAVAKDDEKDAKKAKKTGKITLTRADILTALSEGEVTVG